MYEDRFRSGTPYFIPEIMTRTTGRCHPKAAQIEAQSAAWVREHLSFAFASEERLERFLETRCGNLACWIWPNTPDDWMLDLVNLCQHLFAFDDAYGDRSGIGRDTKTAEAVFSDFFAVMAGAAPRSGHPYALNFEGLWAGVAMPMTLSQRNRYRQGVADWLKGCVREIASRQRGVVLDFEAYMAVRRESVWSAPCFPIIEHGLGVELPEDIVTSHEMDVLHLLCTDCMILINDLFSFPKEVRDGDYVNAVPVLCIHERIDLQHAVNRLCALLHDSETRFIEQRDALLQRHPAQRQDLGRYLAALGEYMAGLLSWTRITPRYHSPEQLANGGTSGRFTL